MVAGPWYPPQETLERSLVMLKPEAVQRGLVGTIMKRFEDKCLSVLALKMVQLDKQFLEEHYAEHKGKDFIKPYIEYMANSGPVVAMVLEGQNAISAIRKMVGATDLAKADVGTIRHDFAIHKGRNLVHASDSVESANREIALWFKVDEIVEAKVHKPKSAFMYEL
ncbi:MAG: hypothetical protein MHPSP_004158 [Paramarteilia canceri]